MKNRLTERQQQILDTLRQIIERTGIPPTRAELSRELGFRSANAAEEHLRALARKGAIELTAGTSRGIRLCEPGPAAAHEVALPTSGHHRNRANGTAVGNGRARAAGRTKAAPAVSAPPPRFALPVLGRVAAGQPMLAAEHVTRHLEVDTQLFAETPHYLLTVRGMSMRDAGILEGDLVAVRRTAEARPGQIVVARLGDEVTVKRLHKVRQQWQLLPENNEFDPIIVTDADDFHIEGRVVGLIRPGPNW